MIQPNPVLREFIKGFVPAAVAKYGLVLVEHQTMVQAWIIPRPEPTMAATKFAMLCAMQDMQPQGTLDHLFKLDQDAINEFCREHGLACERLEDCWKFWPAMVPVPTPTCGPK